MLTRIIITLIVSSAVLYAQGSSTFGNLLRIPIDASQINPADTVGSWISYNYESANGSSHYNDIIHTSSDTFFEKYSWDDYHYFGLYINYSLENFEPDTSSSYGTFVGEFDVVEPYLIQYTIPFKTESGTWLMNGIYNMAYISDDALITILPRNYYGDLIYICTKIDNKYLTVFRKDTTELTYDFYLLDLSESPEVDTTGAQRIYFDMPVAPYKMRRISDLFYIGEVYSLPYQSSTLSLFRFSNNTFHFIKEYFNYADNKWDYRDGYLLRYYNGELFKYDYNPADTSFVDERVLISGGGIHFSNDFSLSAQISGDNLIVYDNNTEQEINSVDISSLWNPHYPVLDSPYVYLHQTTLVTDIKNKPLQPLSYSLQVYPNPFNPATNVLYTLPQRSTIEIKLFDMLGSEVKTIYSGEAQAGTHQLLLNAADISSGIYFISLRSGNYFRTQKIVLLK